jgi:hypothetical protein
MTKPYEISDEDIEKVLRYMKLHVSKNSTLEDARKMLEDFGSDVHKLALNEPDRFLKLKQKIDKRHKA